MANTLTTALTTRVIAAGLVAAAVLAVTGAGARAENQKYGPPDPPIPAPSSALFPPSYHPPPWPKPCPYVVNVDIKTDINTVVAVLAPPGSSIELKLGPNTSGYTAMLGKGVLFLRQEASGDAARAKSTFGVIAMGIDEGLTVYSLAVSEAASAKDVQPSVVLPQCPKANEPLPH